MDGRGKGVVDWPPLWLFYTKGVGMNFDEYQVAAHRTSHGTLIGNDPLLYPAIGYAGEAGELLNKIKKIYRDYGGELTEEMVAALKKEMGDSLWYLAEMATILGERLGDIAAENIAKLGDRAERGVIGGNGDYR